MTFQSKSPGKNEPPILKNKASMYGLLAKLTILLIFSKYDLLHHFQLCSVNQLFPVMKLEGNIEQKSVKKRIPFGKLFALRYASCSGLP